MNTSPVMTEANDTSGYPKVSFGRSADGLIGPAWASGFDQGGFIHHWVNQGA